MSKLVTEKEALLEAFPYSLARDEDKRKLADDIADELVKATILSEYASVFPRVDELPEEVLDILAADLKIQWYEIDAPVESKKAQIKSCFKLHQCLGTKYALITAISDVFPGSDVKEWFEYGGEPFHFTLILDVTQTGSGLPISQDIIERIVNAVKPVRSVLESDSITYRIRSTILISMKSGYVLYSVRKCGTYPYPAIQGGKSQNEITVSSVQKFVGVPSKTNSATGTHPYSAVQGEIQSSKITIMTVSGNAGAIGKTNGVTGTYPDATVEGEANDSYVSFSANSGSASFSTRICGAPLGSL